jgi:hypothetical protein
VPRIVRDAAGYTLWLVLTSRRRRTADEARMSQQREPLMLVMNRIEDWLDHVDPWSVREASDLLQAVLDGGPAGIFDCASSLDGRRWLVMAAHAEAVLCLDASELPVLAEQVGERFGLPAGRACQAWWAQDGLHDERRAANESRPAPLWDAPYVARRSKA